MIPLGPTDAAVWHADPDAIVDPQLLEAYLGLLDVAERVRHQAFAFESGRKHYLVAHALVRTALSAHAPVDPHRWRFEVNEYGKPGIVGPESSFGLSFNLSHTMGRVAVVVALNREVGIDVEAEDRRTSAMEIADRFFSPFEVEALRSLPSERQRERFFAYWTLKESYIKARGLGLAIPLDHFSFHLDELAAAASGVQISFDPRLNDDPATWQFLRLRVGPAHPMAIALRRAGGPSVSITVREAVPLVSVK